MKEKLPATNAIDQKINNVLSVFVNGSTTKFNYVMVAPVSGNNHCIRVGDKVLSLEKKSKKSDNLSLKTGFGVLSFIIQKDLNVGRNIIINLENIEYGLFRFISTSEDVISKDDSFEDIILECTDCGHNHILALLKKSENYSFKTISKSNIKKIIHNKVIYSNQGILFEREVC